MRKILLLFCLLLTGGCTQISITQLKQEYAAAPTPALALQIRDAVLAEEARDLKRAETYENWELCKGILSYHNQIIWHVGHSHSRKIARRITYSDIQSDLRINGCRMVVPRHLWQPVRL